MYLKALIRYEKVLSLDYLRLRSLQDSLQTLDTMMENKALKDEEELVNVNKKYLKYLYYL
jgi:hypothetical protein